VIIGPGKANPFFVPPKEILLGHLYTGLDRLCPVVKSVGTKLLLENMSFAFLPTAQELLSVIKSYGNPDIGNVYDVANGHFSGKDPCEELRVVKELVEIIHLSDTSRAVYKHGPVEMGDVPFAAIAPVLDEIGYRELPVLEIVSRNAEAEIADSARRLAAMGYGSSRSRGHHG
jgi:sugar phosphate isomerase/epimerase